MPTNYWKNFTHRQRSLQINRQHAQQALYFLQQKQKPIINKTTQWNDAPTEWSCCQKRENTGKVSQIDILPCQNVSQPYPLPGPSRRLCSFNIQEDFGHLRAGKQLFCFGGSDRDIGFERKAQQVVWKLCRPSPHSIPEIRGIAIYYLLSFLAVTFENTDFHLPHG